MRESSPPQQNLPDFRDEEITFSILSKDNKILRHKSKVTFEDMPAFANCKEMQTNKAKSPGDVVGP